MPAVLLVLALCVGSVQAVSQQTRLSHSSAAAARLLARGDSSDHVVARIRANEGDVQIEMVREGDFVCVGLSRGAKSPFASTIGFRLASRSCVLATVA